MSRFVFPPCTCDACFHSGPNATSSPACPFRIAFESHRDHDRDLDRELDREADEDRSPRGERMASSVVSKLEASGRALPLDAHQRVYEYLEAKGEFL